MIVKENIPLAGLTSFGVHASAKYFASFTSAGELNELAALKPFSGKAVPMIVLGGGTNVLFTKNYPGLVLHNEIMGIKIIKEDQHHIYLHAGAGENWHQLVIHCVKNDYAGMENLSLIPGRVGASPMQNIGAYGVELKDIFFSLEAFHIHDRKIVNFSLNDCQFGYRESVFKGKYKDQFIITGVTYRLNKTPVFNTSYGAINMELEKMNISELTIQAISQAVMNIRTGKLPDPVKLGNAGSFFKNPIISADAYSRLKETFPTIPGYASGNDDIKLAAGWLIEQCGPKQGVSWKGYRHGEAGCYEKQSLVLVNYGNASGHDILELSNQIKASVLGKFAVKLEIEVNII